MNRYFEADIAQIVGAFPESSFKGSSVLVTGGAGFLGSWMCDALHAMGAEVTCLDNLSSGRIQNISHLQNGKKFNFINHDISELPVLDASFDYVIHMASRAGPFEFAQYPIEILMTNTLGTKHALEIAKNNNARFLFTSTSEVYGDALVVPTPETYYGNVNSVGSRGCYDEAKRCGEALCMAYVREYNVTVRIVRIFNTYGPRIRADGVYGRVIPRFLDQAQKNEPITVFGDGLQTRSFTYVTDQIIGQLKLLLSDISNGEVVNIGNNNEITVLDLANMIQDLVGSQSEITFQEMPKDDPVRRNPDIRKAIDLLGWEPRIDLRTGLYKMSLNL